MARKPDISPILESIHKMALITHGKIRQGRLHEVANGRRLDPRMACLTRPWGLLNGGERDIFTGFVMREVLGLAVRPDVVAAAERRHNGPQPGRLATAWRRWRDRLRRAERPPQEDK
jgi:hypothetical protein